MDTRCGGLHGSRSGVRGGGQGLGAGAGGTPRGTTASPVPVKTSPKLAESAPAADGSWLVWTQHTRHKPRWSDAFAQFGTRRPVRLNERGIQGYTGGVDGHTAVYYQDARGGRTALYTFNLRTRVRHRLPQSLSGDLALNPTISGRRVLFDRITWSDDFQRIILYNLATHAATRLASARLDDTGSSGVGAGQVNGRWAVWLKFWEGASGSQEALIRYNTKTQSRQRITGDGFGPAVSSDGTVYFLRGYPVRTLYRVSVGGTEKEVAQLPGYASDLFVKDRSNGGHAIYFATSHGGRNVDVYKIVDN
jgi:hypothetical protein